MKKLFIPLLFGCLFLSACNNNSNNNETPKEDTPVVTPEDKTPEEENNNPSTPEVPEKKEVVFDFTEISYITIGNEYDLTSKVTTDGNITIKYYDNNNTLLAAKPTELGIYYAEITTTEGSEYKAGSKTVKFRIIEQGWLPWV